MNNHNEELQPPTPDQNSLNFGPLAQGGRETRQMLISNPSKQPLLWHADTGGMNWLTLDKNAGTLAVGKSQSVNVTADTSALALGEHTGSVTFTSEGDALSASVQVPVTLAVPPVSPPAVGLNFTLFLNSSQILPLAITNWNSQAVVWTATVDTDGMDWLTLDRNTGTLQPNEQQTIFVTANSTLLAFGNYAGLLTFTSEVGATKSVGVKLPVELHVILGVFGDSGPKAPTATPNRLDFGIPPLGGANILLSFDNPAQIGKVNWAMGTVGVNWVKLGPLQPGPGGSQTISVTVDKTGLNKGNYQTHLILTLSFVDQALANREPTSVLIPVTMSVP